MTTHTAPLPAAPTPTWPAGEGLLAGLCAGRFRWDTIQPFPGQDTDDRAAGDTVLDELRSFLVKRVDPEQIDATAELPLALLGELRSRGYLGLTMAPALGGRGLSFANAFRVIETAMSWSVPVGWCLAIQNGLGAGAYLPLLPAGPLRELITARVAAGALFSDADTEPSGASNDARTTTATLTADGSAYLIDGEKICIGNGSAAEFLVVSATVGDDVEYFFLDTSTPGFSIRSAQEFLGLRGARIAALSFDQVRVPVDQLLTLDPDVDTEFEVNRPARMYLVAAPALAIAKLCAHWSREFVNRRAIDGRPLGHYDQIQRIVAANLADLFAIESVVEWCLHSDHRVRAEDFRIEQSAAKNITSVACWRIVDRTMSLLAAEGLETARSKAARGAQPLPVERAFRDARALRIAGGVDFLLDKYFGETVILARVLESTDLGPGSPADITTWLSPRNQDHFRFVDAEITAFPAVVRNLVAERTPPDSFLIVLNQIANELLTMSVTLSRTSTLAQAGRGDLQNLADVYCSAARHRLAGWWREAAEDEQPAYGGVAADWLEKRCPANLLDDVMTEPSVAFHTGIATGTYEEKQ